MKQIIRMGTFETNSSSTHSLTMCTEDEYERWKKGELLYHKWNEELVEPPVYTKEELKRAYFLSSVGTISNGILYENTYYTSIEELIDKVEVPEDKLERCKLNLSRSLCTYDSYWRGDDDYTYLEGFSERYTTPNGEKIVAFGKYGYDG